MVESVLAMANGLNLKDSVFDGRIFLCPLVQYPTNWRKVSSVFFFNNTISKDVVCSKLLGVFPRLLGERSIVPDS